MIILDLLALPKMHNVIYRLLSHRVSITIKETKSYSLISKTIQAKAVATRTYDSYCRSTQPD